jgi:hypothetical protein
MARSGARIIAQGLTGAFVRPTCCDGRDSIVSRTIADRALDRNDREREAGSSMLPRRIATVCARALPTGAIALRDR